MLQDSNTPSTSPTSPEAPNADLEVTDKYAGEVATQGGARFGGEDIDRGIAAAVEATEPMRLMTPPYERQAVLAALR